MSKRITVIGGGPAGYEAALHGAALGGEITLVEDHKIGGTCLNYGCIPTKTLIEHAAFYSHAVQDAYMGVQLGEAVLNYGSVQERKEEIITQLVKGIETKLQKSKVNIVRGYGRVLDRNRVLVTMEDGSEQLVEGDRVVLATGSKPMIPSFFEGLDTPGILTSKDLLALETLPETLTIVGGGVIGMEFAFLMQDFGVQVTVLEYAKNLVPAIDSGIGKRLKSVAADKGIQVIVGAKVTGFREGEGQVLTTYEDKKGVHSITADYALMAVGRVGNFNKENMDQLGISRDERFVHVDDELMTNVNGIYAIGDLNGKSLLAHAAYDQGRQVMAHMLQGHSVKDPMIPGCVFTTPEIGTVGLSEDEAKEKGLSVTVQKSLFSASGKALAMNETTGFIKTLADEAGRLVGCHVFGPHASDIVHYGSIAMAAGMTVEQMKTIVFAHPTLGELFSDNMHQY